MLESDYIGVDFYVCGIYRGKRRVHKKSIAGRTFSSDFSGAIGEIQKMNRELNEIPSVNVSGGLSPSAPSELNNLP